MEKSVEVLLEEEIKTLLNELSELESGSQRYHEVSEELIRLYNLKMESDSRKVDKLEPKREQMLKMIVDLIGIGAPLIFYGIWMKRGFEFEEKGTFTSFTFKGLFNRFKPTKV